MHFPSSCRPCCLHLLSTFFFFFHFAFAKSKPKPKPKPTDQRRNSRLRLMDRSKISCFFFFFFYRTCSTIFLAITFFIASAPFLKNNAQPIPAATVVDSPSPSPPPMAKLSTSWINRPSIFINSTEFPGSNLTPVLDGESNGSKFICGFYCPRNATTTAAAAQETHACFFGVLIFESRHYLDDNSTLLNAPHLVWSANRDHPVQINATLQLTQYGDLTLVDADGTLVWTSQTAGKSVIGIKFAQFGNLVLFDRNNATAWQSFDHPTDSLLVGQKLVPGQKLTASRSASNWSRGLYSLVIQDYSLLAYLESNPPLVYIQSEPAVEYVLLENGSVLLENGSVYGQKINVASSTSAQFMRLEPDGHLKVYEIQASNWIAVADLLTSDIGWLTSGIGDCGYPMVCGNYGICSSNGQCSCLEEPSSTFRQINYRQPNLGCSPVTPISCYHSQYHTLLELDNTSYFNLNSEFSDSYLDNKTNLEDCKKSCLKNCSCKAALFAYHTGHSSRKGCLLLSEVYSLRSNEGEIDHVTIFLKVQKSPTTKKSRYVTIILGSSLGAFFGVLFVVASCIFIFRKKGEFEELDEFSVNQVPGMPTRFSYEDLRAMTSNFNNKLGEGGFGSVFQGKLSNGTKVAVKCLKGFGQVKKSFLTEVETIGNIHHVNLVRLIGFCAEKSHRLLVYEYMSNGSLDTWIFQRHQEITLGWQSRRKIIMDIAKGLAYLHEDCRQKILHLDIKPQNILLDEYYNAKISDFGLSKLIDKDQSQVVTMMRGTPGYLAPEWLSSIITEKVDVYSFGVVVLEILCGRKNLDRSQPEEDMHLLSLFKRKAEEEQLLDIVDKCNDEMQLHRVEVVEMMRVVVWCLQSDFSRRPSMSVVVKVLEGSVDVEDNLDYSFTTHVARRAITAVGRQEDAIGPTTPLFPSTLSGPR